MHEFFLQVACCRDTKPVENVRQQQGTAFQKLLSHEENCLWMCIIFSSSLRGEGSGEVDDWAVNPLPESIYIKAKVSSKISSIIWSSGSVVFCVLADNVAAAVGAFCWAKEGC